MNWHECPAYGLVEPLAVPRLLNPLVIFQAFAAKVPVFDRFVARDSWHSYVSFKDEMNQLLSGQVLRQDQSDAPGAQLVDAGSPARKGDGSGFLPLILDLSAENGIQWVFIRERLRPNPDGTQRDVTSQEERDALRDWLTSHGALYFDFSDRADIPGDWFSDDFHMFGHQPEYTEWFYQQFRDMFEQ